MKIFKLGLILGIFAAVSCITLAVVNSFTAPVIAEYELQKEKEGLKIVLPDADSYLQVEDSDVKNAISSSGVTLGSIKIEKLYRAESLDAVSYAAKITGPSYDTTTLLLGLDSDMKITGVHILATSDSPGFGQKAKDPSYRNSKGTTFYGQFAGVSPLAGFEPNKDYEPISGATITSNGIRDMIKAGTQVIKAFADSNK